MHQHQQQQRLQQAMFAQRQQEANLLFHQYNQLRSMQAAYSNPALSPVTYTPQPIDPQQQQQQQQQQQLYRTDQLVPQTQPQIATPVQPQQIQSSSPVQMLSLSAPEAAWLTASPLPQNPDIFHPIAHTVSRTMLDMLPYNNRTNSISSEPSSPPMNASFDSPPSTHVYYSSYQQSSPENHRRRERRHSGSSCYESDSPDSSDEEFEVRENFIFFNST
jgi:hypothetical protein